MLWIRQICGFLILSSLLRYLLPEKYYQTYVKLFLNLLLVLLLARPLLSFDREQMNQVWQEASVRIADENWKQQLNRLVLTAQSREQLEPLLQNELDERLAERGYEADDVTLITDERTGNITEIQLDVKQRNDSITVPAIRTQGGVWRLNEEEVQLEQYLQQELSLSSEVGLSVTIVF